MAERRGATRALSVAETLDLLFAANSDDEDSVVAKILESRIEEESEICQENQEDLYSDEENEVARGANSTPPCAPGDNQENFPDQEDEIVPMDVDIQHEEAAAVEDLPSDRSGDYRKEWCRNLEGFPRALHFHATPGLQGPLNLPPWEECTPIDFFRLFIDKSILLLMKTETNRYARQNIDARKRSGVTFAPRFLFGSWKPVTLREVQYFLSILMHMGIVRKPRIHDHWSKCPLLHNQFPSQLMARERFKSILAFFHLNDNTTCAAKHQPGYDPLHKIRPLLDHLNELFKTVYIPQQQICVDEALCPWRGRVSVRVYMKDKPVKWGTKLYELCESQSGYVFNLEVMCNHPGIGNKPYDVVQPLKSLGYCLYVDNYYCCPALAQNLASNNTGLVGTVRTNRAGLPKEFMNKVIQKGGANFMRHQDVVVMKWKDKREVSVLTTIHNPQMVDVKTRVEQKKKRTAVVDYNKYMSGVDKSDQMNSYMPLHRKTVKWWKKLAFHLLTLTLTQSHCLYLKVRKQIGKPGMGLQDFIISVAKDLASFYVKDDEDFTAAAAVSSGMLRLECKHQHFMERCR